MTSASLEHPRTARFTLSDFERLPDDGNRYEILDGELAMTPSPTTRHQKISRRLHFLLYQVLELTGRGEVYYAPMDVVLDPHTVVAPDIFFVSAERAEIIEAKNIQGAPDLVVEILSPGTRRRDVITKARLYARFGVPHYWLVDPDIDRIEFMALRAGAFVTLLQANAPDIARPEDFEGVVIALGELFLA